ncbi:MAG: DUF5906 domain-containing protein [Planctomycetaceae bacterium]|jgi:putative DNA primase/helicase|nr:DUF5906 domain-containing protein [Planctomycetaceae bacterium]
MIQKKINIKTIKQIIFASKGREIEILQNVAHISNELLDGRGHSCPKCKGKDRFHLTSQESGVRCRQCFPEKNNIVNSVAHFCNVSTESAIQMIDKYICAGSNRQSIPPQKTTSATPTAKKSFDPKIFNCHWNIQESEVAGLLAKRQGITIESLHKADARISNYFGKPIVAIPTFSNTGQITGAVMFRADGESFDNKKKILTQKDSIAGIVGKDAIENLLQKKQAHTIYLTAGVSDYLTLSDKIHSEKLENEYYCFTTSAGEGEKLGKYRELIIESISPTSTVVVIADNDKAGDNGAKQRAETLSSFGLHVKILKLPLYLPKTADKEPIKDIRDFFNAGGRFSELIANTKNTPLFVGDKESENGEYPEYVPPVSNNPDDCFHQLINVIKPINWSKYATASGSIQEETYILLTLDILHSFANREKLNLLVYNEIPYIFNDTHWIKISTEQLRAFLTRVAINAGVPKNPARYYQFQNKIIEQFRRTFPQSPPNTTSLNLLNGTLDFVEGDVKFREHDPADFFQYVLNFSYDSAAECPRWQSHLDRVLPTVEKQEYLAELFALPFAKHIKIEKVALLYGSGANGKSVCLDVYSALLGNENITSISLEALTKPEARGDYMRAELDRKLVNIATDISPKISDSGMFKTLVSGESITARSIYGKPFNMQNYARLIFAMNELPHNAEKTDAYFRRLAIVEFSEKIQDGEKNINLAREIIRNELSGVLNWLVAGFRRLVLRGDLPVVSEIESVRERYRLDSDTVLQWLTESEMFPVDELTDNNTNYLLLQDAYDKYREYVANEGNRNVLTKRKFHTQIESLGFRVKYNGRYWRIYFTNKPNN